jgi:hypothetical protein
VSRDLPWWEKQTRELFDDEEAGRALLRDEDIAQTPDNIRWRWRRSGGMRRIQEPTQ